MSASDETRTAADGHRKYMGRISGPLLDRVDLHIEVPPVPFEDLSKPGDGTGSAVMREQVFAARTIQGDGSGRLFVPSR